jgi:hypothetical protein
MFLKKNEFDIIKKAVELLPRGEAFKNLNENEKKIILDADALLIDLLRKKKRNNAKTAAYIANKRKNNKNYARSKKQ